MGISWKGWHQDDSGTTLFWLCRWAQDSILEEKIWLSWSSEVGSGEDILKEKQSAIFKDKSRGSEHMKSETFPNTLPL